MCTLAFALKIHSKYPFIFVGNRDEFYERPTQRAHWWEETEQFILAGKDLKKGGTWTGINRAGKVAFITNYRDFSRHLKSPLSRGLLTRDFLLEGSPNAKDYLNQINENAERYDPFNLLVGDINKVHYYSNISGEIIEVESGVHGMSNAFLNTPWPKVVLLKEGLSKLIQNDEVVPEKLFKLLSDRREAPEALLPDTGIDLALEKTLSSLYIEMPKYGTRYQTVILVDREMTVHYYERERGSQEIVEKHFSLERT